MKGLLTGWLAGVAASFAIVLLIPGDQGAESLAIYVPLTIIGALAGAAHDRATA